MIAQGYGCNRNIILQDNESSVLLETNGKASSGKRTRHMNFRYFGIADRVDKKEAEEQGAIAATDVGASGGGEASITTGDDGVHGRRPRSRNPTRVLRVQQRLR